MYRGILLHEEDKAFVRIFFRESQDEPLIEYELQTVTYGLVPSAYLAQRSLIQLARDEGSSFPLAASVLEEDAFIDDFLVGQNSVESLLDLMKQLRDLLARAGFKLNKWSSNSPEFLEGLKDTVTDSPLIICEDGDRTVKVLGIQWNPVQDVFQYKVVVPLSTSFHTKRSILSTIARIYDPLGFLAPLIMTLKVFLQTLWKQKLSWDEPINNEHTLLWADILHELPRMSVIKIPRYMFTDSVDFNNFLILGFSDASERGFGAVTYLRATHTNQPAKLFLLKAKSKVSPLKSLSIPRLELNGALLLAKLVKSLKPHFTKLNVSNYFLFTDSMVTLAWLHKPPHLLKTYVANRVVSILDITDQNVWRHVRSADNPADLASRGLTPAALSNSNLWFEGPEWAKLPPEEWPSSDREKSYIKIHSILVPDLKVITPPVLIIDKNKKPTENVFILLFNNFSHLRLALAVIRRYFSNNRKPGDQPQLRMHGHITVSELNDALLSLIKLTQQTYFSDEIMLISKGKPCKQSIQKLAPFLDTDGILRVGGRLSNSLLDYNTKHPYLLPGHGHFVKLLIDYYHRSYMHAGNRTLHALLQRYFWILSPHTIIRQVIHTCVRCSRFRSNTANPVMGNLPAYRVCPSRPFSHTGVDIAGPYVLREYNRRKAPTFKAYFALFICMATKAVHIEPLTSLSTEAFLATLSRFTSRRGVCSDIYSDQATNFKGAAREMKEIINFISCRDIQNTLASTLAKQSINFWFNIAHAPFMVGIWESNIKNVKWHLKRVVGNNTLTLEEFFTLLARAEAILNSRPLYQLSASPQDLQALTPGHFLTGNPITALPEYPLTDINMHRLSRWQLVSQMSQHLWKRWEREYLHTLQQRNKWFTTDANLEVGQLVWICEDHAAPLSYPLGIIDEIILGKDGVVRSAKVRTATGCYDRPVRKLAPLPLPSTHTV